MSEDNVELIRGVYAAFASGDVPAVLGAMAPDIEWNEAENFAYSDGNPYRGADAILNGVFARLGGEWDGFAVVPEAYIGDGETVAVTGRYRGTYKASGKSVDAQMVHVWRISNGKIAGFQQHTDTLQFARAMGGA